MPRQVDASFNGRRRLLAVLAAPPPAPIPKRPRASKLALTIAVAWIVAIAAVAAYLILRPVTVREVLTWDHWSPGTVDLVGTVTNVQAVNTTYGPAVLLGLAGDPVCGAPGMSVFGDPTATYRIG